MIRCKRHGIENCAQCFVEEERGKVVWVTKIDVLKAQMDALVLFKTRLLQKYSRKRTMDILEFRLFVTANLEETIKEILNA